MDRVMELTTNLSDPLLDLVDNGQAPIDGVEVGPWFSEQQTRDYRQRLPELPFYFHGGHLIAQVGWFPGTAAKIAAYVQSTGSPWASMHLSMWFPGMVSLMMGRGWRLPRPNVERATRRLVRQVKRLIHALEVPVILENMPSLPFDGYDFEADPGRITDVLDETGCSFLLDTGHASVAAAALGLEAEAYVSALPLDRVVQVHVSGPRMKGGRRPPAAARGRLCLASLCAEQDTAARGDPRIHPRTRCAPRSALSPARYGGRPNLMQHSLEMSSPRAHYRISPFAGLLLIDSCRKAPARV
jgi:hypothetical protein